MTRYAILLGDAPEDFRQTKIEDMFDFLSSKDEENRGGVVTFPNGISEMMLELVLDNTFKQNPKQILLYICAQSPVKDSDKSLWLGGEEIRRDVIEHYQRLATEAGIDLQVVMDWCKDLASEEELGYEEADSSCHCDLTTRHYEQDIRHCERSEAISKSNKDCFVASAPRNDGEVSKFSCNDERTGNGETR